MAMASSTVIRDLILYISGLRTSPRTEILRLLICFTITLTTGLMMNFCKLSAIST